MITLEDELDDIIGKAARGLGVSVSELQLSTTNLNQLSNDDLAKVSSKLNLSCDALIHLYKKSSETPLPSEVEMITSSFGHLGVNAFVVKYQQTTYLIDTGTEHSKVSHLSPDKVLITHNHPDHTACSNSFSCPIIMPEMASMLSEIQVFDVSGHCTPSAAYFFSNLSTPVCFVGDSLFKRSIGGCRSIDSYSAALKNVNHLLNTLPSNTILCVGHGPNTNVAQELKENPFFAKE